MNIENLSIQSLKKAVSLKEKIEALNTELASILSNGGEIPSPFKSKRKGMSAAGRAKVAAAQKKRWAKVKAAKPMKKGRKKMSAAAKAKISAAAKARWAKVKAAGKSRL